MESDSLMTERDRFGTVRLVRHSGRIGTNDQEKAEEFDSENEAGKALETLAQVMRREGYRPSMEPWRPALGLTAIPLSAEQCRLSSRPRSLLSKKRQRRYLRCRSGDTRVEIV
jgi:predicted DNA-binding WGR domain protein